jgi:UDP-N-acetylmuramate--alanine ligase
VRNATAALVMADALGADHDALAEALATFAGAGRRMELIADTAAVTIYDDYGHHPTVVRAALSAARQKVRERRRLWAVFEPHTPEAMAATSAEALADAIERTSGVPTIATGDADATTAYVADHLAPGDAVLVMGAGKSYRIARGLAERLA